MVCCLWLRFRSERMIAMSKVKLKPCPFCGAKPFLLINSSAERIYVKIKCDRCNVERLDIIAGLCTWGELECCKDRVLEKWNTRYTENPSKTSENTPNLGENNLSE